MSLLSYLSSRITFGLYCSQNHEITVGIRSRVNSILKRAWWVLFGKDNHEASEALAEKCDYASRVTPANASEAIAIEPDTSGDTPTTLSCETYEVSVDAEIDYVDKNGKFSRREITTDQVFDYEDGVLVIRAFCHRRKDYRTFVSKRIQHWKDTASGQLVSIGGLSKYLRGKSDVDSCNVASNIFYLYVHEIHLAIDALTRFSGNSATPKNQIGGKKRNSLVDWIWSQDGAHRYVVNLDEVSRKECYAHLKVLITDARVSRPVFLSSVSVLRKGSETRKQQLIDFISKCLSGLPEHDSAVSVLKDELLHPSFSIQSTKETPPERKQEQVTEQDFVQARSRVASSQKKYRKSKKRSARSIAYRNYERNDPVRMCALKEAQLQLGIKQLDGELVFDREEFELKIRQKLLTLMSEEDLEDQGEMFLRRLGSGISLAYLTFGLKKKNRGWYDGPDGRCVIDLRNASAD
jgi:hypothetical protein